MRQRTIFAEENRLEKLSELGDCLERLKIIDWESFRPTIALALNHERKSNAGRPPYDCILLFKTIILQRLYNLSDDQTEYQINDRMKDTFVLDSRKSHNTVTAKADVYLSGIVQLVAVLLADSMHKQNLFKSIRKLIA